MMVAEFCCTMRSVCSSSTNWAALARREASSARAAMVWLGWAAGACPAGRQRKAENEYEKQGETMQDEDGWA